MRGPARPALCPRAQAQVSSIQSGPQNTGKKFRTEDIAVAASACVAEATVIAAVLPNLLLLLLCC